MDDTDGLPRALDVGSDFLVTKESQPSHLYTVRMQSRDALACLSDTHFTALGKQGRNKAERGQTTCSEAIANRNRK